MTIGERIRQRRQELGLTQTDLAERLQLKSKASVSLVETDKEDLTTTRLSKYAEALECTPSYLMGWTDEAQANIDKVKNTLSNLSKNGFTTKEFVPDNAYYIDEDAAEYADFLHKNPDYKVLFDASRKVKPEDIDFVRQLIERTSHYDS